MSLGVFSLVLGDNVASNNPILMTNAVTYKNSNNHTHRSCHHFSFSKLRETDFLLRVANIEQQFNNKYRENYPVLPITIMNIRSERIIRHCINARSHKSILSLCQWLLSVWSRDPTQQCPYSGRVTFQPDSQQKIHFTITHGQVSQV